VRNSVRNTSAIASISNEAQFSDMTTVRKHRPDYLIPLYMGLLMLLGLVIIYATGSQRANVLNNAYGSNYSDMYFFTKQIVSLSLSVVVFIAMSIFPYSWLTKNAGKLLMVGLGACALLALSSWLNLPFAQQTLGATRWFNLGALGSLQPAELLKFTVLVFLAGFLGRKVKQGKLNDRSDSLFPVAVIAAICMLFVVIIQKDLGTGIALASIFISMLFVAGINKKNIVIIITTIAIAGAMLIFSAPHRIQRVVTYLQGDNTSAESSDSSSYHIEQAKLAIGSGGLFGVGIGNSVQSTGYLPEAINDSVFAIMGETFGFVGLITILALFCALLMRLLQLMDHLVDIRLKLLVAGVFGWFGAHVILNIASMIGVFPLTGITLPLLSSGGTSMLFIAAALGLVFQLSHYTVRASILKEANNENFSGRRGVGRSRYSSRSSTKRD
jgi:cell division protein FtsW